MMWILTVLLLLMFSRNGNTENFGPYVIDLYGMRSFANNHPSQVESFFYIQQLNMSDRAVRGFINVSLPTGPLVAHFVQYLWADSDFSPSAGKIDVTGPACQVHQVVLGILTHVPGFNTTTCSISSGNYRLDDLNFDAVYHKLTETMPYLRAKLSFTWLNMNNEELFGFSVDVETKKHYKHITY